MSNPSDYTITTQVLALCRYGGLTARQFETLFLIYKNPSNILNASVESLMHIKGMTKPLATRISTSSKQLDEADKYVKLLNHRGITLLTRFDENFNHLLFELNDPPPIVFLRGHLPSPEKQSVTLVGTITPTVDGINVTSRVAQEFAKAGVQVVSSLHGGIDSAAHLSSKKHGGVSFAVLDTGFDTLDDLEQVPIAIDIALTGGVISEYPPDYKRQPQSLEESNRILVGLSQAVVITEVYQDSRSVHDLLDFCFMIGKMVFLIIDSKVGPLYDKESLEHAITCGAIPLQGSNQIEDIIKSLV
jgi:DNA processing protein